MKERRVKNKLRTQKSTIKKKATMKKTYQNPKTTIVEVQTAQMIASSPVYGGTTTATSGNLSRENGDSFWDDEEDF